MNQFKPSVLTLALFAAGLTMPISGVALAQEQAAQQSQTDENQADKKEDEKKVESIQIRGFRGSVVKALNTKRYSDTVVDAISADDIGGLPDVSIADALTRMPGVTSIRIDGQSSELNIRGLSGGFVFSTLNGREQVSSAGGRAVQFDQFPSELIEQAQVYKSQKASLIEGGTAGTIELKTANALDNDEDEKFRFSAHGNWNEAAADNEDSGSFGHRLTASWQKKLFDETVGISVGVARMFQPTVSSRFVNYKFENLQEKTGFPDFSSVYPGAPDKIYVSDGFEINERGGEDTRNAFVSALNWQVNDKIHVQGDIFYSDFKSDKWDRGLRVNGLQNMAKGEVDLTVSNPNIIQNPNGGYSLIGGTFTRDPNGMTQSPTLERFGVPNMNVQTQADDNSTDSSLLSWGLKADWEISGRLTATFDLAHSEAEETYHDRVIRMAMFEDSSAATPLLEDNLVMNYHLNGLGIPQVSFNQDFTDINKMMVTSAEAYPHIEDNQANALRADFNYELDNEHFTSIEAGIRFSKREHELDRGRFVYGTTDFKMRNGQYITYVKEDGELVEVERFQPFQLTDDMVSVTNIGGDLASMPSFLAINNNQVLNAWLPGIDRTPIKDWDHSWTMTQNNIVEEDVTAIYFQANIDSQLFGLPVTGNIGMRIVDSEQKSTGLIFVGGGNGEAIPDDTGAINNDYRRGTEGISYTDYLPSLNLNFSLTDNDQLRFAYAKVMSRPDMKDMANSGSFDFDAINQQVHFNSTTSPFIRPFYADQVDISYEHYLEDGNGAIVVALWHKEISNFPTVDSDENVDLASFGLVVPEAPDNKQYDNDDNLINYTTGTYKRAVNVADAGYVRGIEFAYTQTFDFLPDLWKGLGVNLNYSYTESDILVPSAVPGEEDKDGILEGLSPRVISATVFYDYDEKFSARVSARHRAAYRSSQIAVGQDEEAYFEEETILSAQISYNFTENLQGVVSMDNITDEPNRSYFLDSNHTGTIQYFGRTLYFGMNYKL